jgi:hypothetical protein
MGVDSVDMERLPELRGWGARCAGDGQRRAQEHHICPRGRVVTPSAVQADPKEGRLPHRMSVATFSNRRNAVYSPGKRKSTPCCDFLQTRTGGIRLRWQARGGHGGGMPTLATGAALSSPDAGRGGTRAAVRKGTGMRQQNWGAWERRDGIGVEGWHWNAGSALEWGVAAGQGNGGERVGIPERKRGTTPGRRRDFRSPVPAGKPRNRAIPRQGLPGSVPPMACPGPPSGAPGPGDRRGSPSGRGPCRRDPPGAKSVQDPQPWGASWRRRTTRPGSNRRISAMRTSSSAFRRTYCGSRPPRRPHRPSPPFSPCRDGLPSDGRKGTSPHMPRPRVGRPPRRRGPASPPAPTTFRIALRRLLLHRGAGDAPGPLPAFPDGGRRSRRIRPGIAAPSCRPSGPPGAMPPWPMPRRRPSRQNPHHLGPRPSGRDDPHPAKPCPARLCGVGTPVAVAIAQSTYLAGDALCPW